MKDKKFYSLVSDTTFKYLFKNEKTRFFFDELISYYTNLDISKFHLIDNELSSGNNSVSYKLDSILTNEDESIILNVEMNKNYYRHLDTRNRRYLHKLASFSKDNKSYKKKIIVIQLNLNNFESSNDKRIAKETYQLYDKDNDIIIDDFIIHSIFIPTEVNSCYNYSIKKKLELFLCDSFNEMRKVIDKDGELKIIMDELERLNNEKYFGGLYDAEEEQKKLELSAREEGFEDGHSIGLQEGHNNEKVEIAKRMLNKNLDIKLISEVTNLSINEIKDLTK